MVSERFFIVRIRRRKRTKAQKIGPALSYRSRGNAMNVMTYKDTRRSSSMTKMPRFFMAKS